MKVGRWDIDPRGFLRDAVNVVGLILASFALEWFVFGIGLFVLGACLHFWSKGVLVRNWTVTMGGPYRVVRHPFYLANFIIDMGICFISGSLILTLLYLPAYLLTYIPTIRREEKFLVDSYGQRYLDYAKKVPALLPYRFLHFFGPLDATWDNIVRENEIPRLLRILAIPFYFLMVYAFRMPHEGNNWKILLASAAAMAVGLNATAILVRRYHARLFWKDL